MNIVLRVAENARAFPDRRALAWFDGRWHHRTYREVDDASDACAWALQSAGIRRGTRTILMVPPGPDLVTVLFGLIKVGAVPVVVDPGMGIGRMLDCYRTVQAEAFVGIRIAHLVRRLAPRTFAAVRVAVDVGKRLASVPRGPFPVADASADDPLMINFTTGSTGPAKGVECTHGMAAAMVRSVSEVLGVGPGAVGLVTLPLLTVVDLVLGCTSVLAPMDVTRPADVDARALVDAATAFAATHMFASPALLRRFASACATQGLRLPDSLRTIASGGAPVTVSIVEATRAVLPAGARLETTYGATEALPIASLDSDAIVAETAARTAAGAGTCVGRPVSGLDVRIIPISDAPIASAPALPSGEVGEIAIAGDVVSPRYPHDPAADALHKFTDGRRWHRTGDLGWLDERGRLWFAGRKSQRVGARFTVQVEGVFNAHPDVHRTALVGVGAEPVVCVELRRPADRARVESELRALAERSPVTQGLTRFLFHPAFPVDIRHNAKIGREALAAWATRRLGRQPRDPRLWLRAVPVAGWLFLLFGVVRPFAHPAWRAVWWTDAFLSVVVHGVQLVPALPRARDAGYPRWQAVLHTFLFGATWWRPLGRKR